MASLISEIIDKRKARANRGLREGRGNSIFRETVIVVETCGQVPGKCIICREIDGPDAAL